MLLHEKVYLLNDIVVKFDFGNPHTQFDVRENIQENDSS